MSAGLALVGCASKKKADPLEGINRGIYAINKTVDALYLKPIATAATKFLPDIVLAGIDNFFDNLMQLPVIANDLFQFKFKEAGNATARFVINSTLGVGGVFDFASKAKLTKHSNDFGQTLAFYGYKESIYIVLPFVGPSTVRDGIGRGVDMGLSAWPYIHPERRAWMLYSIYVVDVRARNLKKEEVLKEAAVDEYILVRDAYLQNRRYQFGLELESLDEAEGEWSPLEDGVNTDPKEQDKEKEEEKDKEKKDAASPDTEAGSSSPSSDMEKTAGDKAGAEVGQTDQDKDLENKMKMTPEALEASQGKTKSAKELREWSADLPDIKGTSTLPDEKPTSKKNGNKNH